MNALRAKTLLIFCGLWPFLFFAASAAADAAATTTVTAVAAEAAAVEIIATADPAAEAALQHLQGAGIRPRDSATEDKFATNELYTR